MNRIADLRFDREKSAYKTARACYRYANAAICMAFHSYCGGAVFFIAAWQLNTLALKLAPLAIAVLFFYSFTKRFTNWSHLFLGFALGIRRLPPGSPSRAALTCACSSFAPRLRCGWADSTCCTRAKILSTTEAAGLFSVPKKFGIANALLIARAMHIGVVALLLWLAFSFGLPWPAWRGIAVVASLLAYEHSLVKADDLSKLDAAFFRRETAILVCVPAVLGRSGGGMARLKFRRIQNERTDNH